MFHVMSPISIQKFSDHRGEVDCTV